MALSDAAIKQLTEHIEAESRRWVQEYVEQRKAVLKKRKINASGELISSMQYAVTSLLNSAVTNTIEIAFAEQGRFVDLKRMNVPHGGDGYIQALSDWIVKKGLFDKFVSGYIERRNPRWGILTGTPPPSVLTSMAWGIAVTRSTRYRRKAWYAKSSNAAVTDLFNRVAGGLPDIVIEEMKKGFTTN